MIEKSLTIEASRGDAPGGGHRDIEGRRAAPCPVDLAVPATEIKRRTATVEFQFHVAGIVTRSGRQVTEDTKTSLALKNMRGLVILIVLAFHSFLAYLGFLGSAAFPFDQPPFGWRAFPIVDRQRWVGFDVFCAWQDVYLMSLFFFLSALFAWPSLARKGSHKFLSDRLLRLGVPFLFGLVVVTPVALYPAYCVTAADPSAIAYGQHFLALPFWPNGPMWFLWLLIALTVVAAGLHRLAPHWVVLLARLSSRADARPGQYFVCIATAATLAYVPLALAFTPWYWSEHGPFALQLSRPLMYAVYYFAGLGVGAYGLERGLLAAEGMLAQHWGVWLTCALTSFLLWMGLTSLAMSDTKAFVLQLGADISFALAGASGCFFMLAACLRFGAIRSRLFDSLSNNALGIYLLHYVFVVWLQYALLELALIAIAKAMIVFGGTLFLAWAAVSALRLGRFGSRLIGEKPPALASPAPLRSCQAVKRNISREDPQTTAPPSEGIDGSQNHRPIA
jgi:glucans biosynthesis protein C